jgi:hypothetical protein
MRTFLRIARSQSSLITYWGIAVILVVVFMNFRRWKNHDVISYDTLHYYTYLPSAFIYHDLSAKYTDTDPDFFADKIWYTTTPEGNRVFKVSMGMSICYLPFFLLADAYAHITGAPADGFSQPYKFALVWSSFFYAMAGLYFLRKLLRVWFIDELLISFVMLLVIFGTNLFNYVTYNNAMSHSYSFALITAFIWCTEKWHRKATVKRSIALGILAGWIFLVRPVNLLVIFIFAGWGMHSMLSIIERIRYFFVQWKSVLLIGFCAFLFILPQLFYWKYNTGQWFFYSYTGEHFYFAHPRISEGLFSWRKGWLLYTPVMVLTFLALPFFRTKVRELTLVYPILFIVILYVTFSWWCWWYGGGFGQRSLIDWYGFFALPIAALLDGIQRKKIAWIFTVCILVLLTAWNQLQHVQYRYMSIHYDSMTRKAYFYNFARVKKRPGVETLFKAPDYDKARAGEREYFWE